MLDYRHLVHGVPLDITTLNAERQELINWKLMNQPNLPGMTIEQIAEGFHAHYGVTPVKTVGWTGSLSWQTFHSDLISALLSHQLVIVLVQRAFNLPDNQPNVNDHFLLVGGIDTNLGYFCCNGDTKTALQHGGIVSPVWYTSWNLESAMPGAYMILPAIESVSSVGVPAGWHDDANTKVLTAPNGNTAVLGFRDYILSHAWDAADVPISAAFHATNLLEEDRRWGAGDILPCLFSVLMYADNPDPAVAPKGFLGKMPVGKEWFLEITKPGQSFSKIEQAFLNAAHAVEGN
jgi:hypothetical protein